MSTVTIRATLSSEELIHAVEQLDVEELEHFSQNVLRVRAGRLGGNILEDEAELIRGINELRPAEFQRRYRSLIKKRNSQILTDAEYTELLEITDRAELYDAARLEKLVQLSAVRGCTLDEVMAQLGLPNSRT